MARTDAVAEHSPTRWLISLTCLLIATTLPGACGEQAPPEDVQGVVTDVADTGAPTDGGCVRNEDCPEASAPCLRPRCNPDGACAEVPDDGRLCEDGEPCTMVDVCKAGKCQAGSDWCACHEDADCAGKVGQDACAGKPFCDKSAMPFTCRANPASAVVCSADKDTICATNRCDPLTGECAMKAVNAGAACEDGDPCTLSSCVDGACEAGAASTCQCEKDADCDKFEDKDACNGTLYCDLKQWPLNVCKVNPSTIVTCDDSKDGGCIANTCDKTTGKCAMQPRPDGTLCDDGDTCTGGDACSDGKCDGAEAVCKCSKNADCDKLEDGNLCNGVLYCDLASASCKLNPKTVVSCPTVGDSACSKNLCNPSTGTCNKTAVPPGTTCNDGDKCTVGEVCVGGACTAGSNACACKSDADCADQEDGNQCNGTLFCNLQSGVCEPKVNSAVVCKTVADTLCSKAACNPKDGTCALSAVELTEMICLDGNKKCGRQLKPAGAPPGEPPKCNDGDICTDSDTCKGGKCLGGADLCSCKTDKDCADEEDGNPCNGTLYCDKSGDKATCKVNPATVVKCPDSLNEACRVNSCVPKTGKCLLLGKDDYTPCDDGNDCTKSDFCLGGSCKAGAMTCECQTNADCAAKDDGDLCNGVPYCDLKAKGGPECKPNPVPVLCPKPSSPCLANTCDKPTGKCVLAAAAAGKPCNDGSACTVNDACKGGNCVGAPADCDDKNACTKELCEPVKGCGHLSTECDDNQPCTKDACDAKTGNCTFDSKALAGKPCDADGNGCTVGDSCQGGTCTPGPPAVCKGEGSPCAEPKCAPTSAHTFTCAVVGKADGADCDDGKGCLAGATCKGGKCQPGKKGRLYARTWPVTGGHARATAVAAWSKDKLAVAGHVHAGDPAKPDKSTWWLDLRDELGEADWAKAVTLTSGKAHAEVRVAGVVAVGGELQVLGTVAGAKGGLDGHLWRVDGDGKVLGQLSYGKPAPSDEVVRAVASMPAGGLVLVGDRSEAGEQQLLVMRTSSAGQPLWTVAVGDKGADSGAAVATRVDGAIVVVGYAQSAPIGAETASVRKLDATGKTTWSSAPAQSKKGRLQAVLSSGEEWLAGGWRSKDGGQAGWLMRMADGGKLLWQRDLAGGVVIHGLASSSPDRFIAVGNSDPAGGNSDHWLGGLDGPGNLHWSRGIDGGKNDTAAALLAVPGSSDLAVVGARQAAKGWQPALLRMDAWGHTSCQGAGECHGKKGSICVADKACTADTCVAVGGCQHKPGQALTCDPKDGCTYAGACDKGACKPTEDGRLFHRALGSEVPFGLTDPVVLDDGGVAALGVAKIKGGEALHVLRFDDRGVLKWHQQVVMKQHVARGGIQLATDGASHLVAVYSIIADNPQNSSKWRQHAVVFDGGGKLVSHDSNPVAWSALHDVQPLSLGGFVTLGGPLSGKAGAKGILLTRLDAKGKVVSSSAHNSSNPSWETWQGYAVLPLPGNKYVVVGHTSKKKWGCKPALFAKLSGSGGHLGRREVCADYYANFYSVAPAGDDGYIVVGETHSSGDNRSLLVSRFPADGQPYWTKKMAEPFDQYGNGVTHRGGIFVVSTYATPGSKAVSRLLGINASGALVWQRNYLLGKENNTSGDQLADLADGGIWHVGGATIGGKRQGTLLRADAWGHVSCKQAGTCAAKTAKNCDDGNVCTGDLCDASKGCVHQPFDGPVCGIGKVCKAGVCAKKN